eukprot:709009-Karenia_brevis.AAC.1
MGKKKPSVSQAPVRGPGRPPTPASASQVSARPLYADPADPRLPRAHRHSESFADPSKVASVPGESPLRTGDQNPGGTAISRGASKLSVERIGVPGIELYRLRLRGGERIGDDFADAGDNVCAEGVLCPIGVGGVELMEPSHNGIGPRGGVDSADSSSVSSGTGGRPR